MILGTTTSERAADMAETAMTTNRHYASRNRFAWAGAWLMMRRLLAVTLLACASVWALPYFPEAMAGASPPSGLFSSGINATSTAFGNLVTAATASSARTSLGLGSGNSPTFTGLTLSGSGTYFNPTGGGNSYINSNGGNVGIGTTAPANLLETRGSSTVGIDYGSAVAQGKMIKFYENRVANPNWIGASIDFLNYLSNYGGGFAFSYHPSNGTNDGTLTTGMVLNASGNVGIRTTNPQAMLSIGTTAGTARIYNSFTDASNGEWAYLGSWGPTANVATYGTDKNGTGVARAVQFMTGGTVALSISAAQVISLPVVTTGTPVASLCLDGSGNIIKKTTSGACI